MVKQTSYMFITGPEVVKSVTQEEVTMENLGGSEVHSTRSGVAHCTADNDMDCILKIREFMSFLPNNNMEEPPFVPTTDSPNRIDPQLDLLVPTNPNQPYDMKELILSVADDQNFFEIQEEYAKNIIIGYIRLNGKTIGVVANQPAALAGTLDINAPPQPQARLQQPQPLQLPQRPPRKPLQAVPQRRRPPRQKLRLQRLQLPPQPARL